LSHITPVQVCHFDTNFCRNLFSFWKTTVQNLPSFATWLFGSEKLRPRWQLRLWSPSWGTRTSTNSTAWLICHHSPYKIRLEFYYKTFQNKLLSGKDDNKYNYIKRSSIKEVEYNIWMAFKWHCFEPCGIVYGNWKAFKLPKADIRIIFVCNFMVVNKIYS